LIIIKYFLNFRFLKLILDIRFFTKWFLLLRYSSYFILLTFLIFNFTKYYIYIIFKKIDICRRNVHSWYVSKPRKYKPSVQWKKYQCSSITISFGMYIKIFFLFTFVDAFIKVRDFLSQILVLCKSLILVWCKKKKIIKN